jgi:hypothetical protein
VIHESERVLFDPCEIVFKVNSVPWHMGVEFVYTERRCNLIATVQLYNPILFSVILGPRSWEENAFWCLRGHEPERLGQLIEHVVKTTIQESNREHDGEEGWQG